MLGDLPARALQLRSSSIGDLPAFPSSVAQLQRRTRPWKTRSDLRRWQAAIFVSFAVALGLEWLSLVVLMRLMPARPAPQTVAQRMAAMAEQRESRENRQHREDRGLGERAA